MERRDQSQNYFLNVLYGGIVSGSVQTIFAPIDRVKLLLQLQPSIKGMELQSNHYRGIFDCIKRVRKEQGFRSFWRGNFTNFIKYYPSEVISILSFNLVRPLLPKYDPRTNFWKQLASSLSTGVVVGFLSISVSYPLEYIRTRLAADIGTHQTREFSGIRHVFQQTVEVNGVRGLYKGVGSYIAGMVSYRALYYGLYDFGNNYIIYDRRNIHLFWIFLYAQFANIFAGTLAYSLDTVMRRMMMQNVRKEVLYNSTFDCIKKIYKNEGIRGFFKGCSCNIFKNLSSALIVTTFYS